MQTQDYGVRERKQESEVKEPKRKDNKKNILIKSVLLQEIAS